MVSNFSRGSALVFLPSQEHRWALAGLLLALVMLAFLVSVMNENAAQAQNTRDEAQQKMQERGRCNILRDRREREQCLLDLRLSEQAQIAGR